MQFSSDPPGGVRVLCPARSWGRSGFLGARGQDDGGGQAVHAQRRDVDLVTAVGGKLRTDTNQTSVRKTPIYTTAESHSVSVVLVQLTLFSTTQNRDVHFSSFFSPLDNNDH